MCNSKPEVSLLEMVEKARKAQQRFDMNNDVQLELDWQPPDTDSTSDLAEKT